MSVRTGLYQFEVSCTALYPLAYVPACTTLYHLVPPCTRGTGFQMYFHWFVDEADSCCVDTVCVYVLLDPVTQQFICVDSRFNHRSYFIATLLGSSDVGTCNKVVISLGCSSQRRRPRLRLFLRRIGRNDRGSAHGPARAERVKTAM